MKTNLIALHPESFVSVFEDMNRFFGDFLGSDMTRSFEGRSPVVDVRETDDAYFVEAELPGLSEKDVDLKLNSRVLTISSGKKDDVERKADGYLVRERRSFSFRRDFRLPEDADPERIKASFANGLLTIELGKRPESKERVIEIGK